MLKGVSLSPTYWVLHKSSLLDQVPSLVLSVLSAKVSKCTSTLSTQVPFRCTSVLSAKEPKCLSAKVLQKPKYLKLQITHVPKFFKCFKCSSTQVLFKCPSPLTVLQVL